ncbi:hypothetical protein Cgig2_026591 [Carnegiea gigantea]|uniref:Uncharacterized protein n=1 Tax=Carnegiea gigantea TaxID=171969 RepID=A0A9Q1QJC5_9CARY|nr:hypothetical protein Cgig2_026591 [Carnegiea gigantea]
MKTKRFVDTKLQELKIDFKVGLKGQPDLSDVEGYGLFLPPPYPPKVDFIETQAKEKPQRKNIMINDEDRKSDEEDDDEFEGESTGSDRLKNTDSNGLESNYSYGFGIDEDQIFDFDFGDDDKWERGVIAALRDIFPIARRNIYLMQFIRNFQKLHFAPKLSLLLSRAAKTYLSVNYIKPIESLHKESSAAYTWLPLENILLLVSPLIDKNRGSIKKVRRRDKDEGPKKRTRGRSNITLQYLLSLIINIIKA